ncbi:aminoglycoside phosphotransferase family protein [Bacillus sp. Marseille-P3661]|uniref:aminoglycoside phosphotransferase family protein n=1 Tax=Bacillus sp. Marseille-P3661 TaxID=1936234 RepID=UPI0015E17AAA|nr:aminoglycoside phosphotransferase family protein [Bacillus sp. Marseille-P3661]
MREKTQLPSTDAIISAYENCYGNSRKVLQVKVISTVPKIRKMIVEYLVTYHNQDGKLRDEYLIGKVYSDQEKGLASFQFLQYLWNNGFSSDLQYTIVRPIAYLQQWRMMIMSKSPGKTFDDWIHAPNADNMQLAVLISNWLTSMHAIPLTEVRKTTRTRANADVERFYKELAELLPGEKAKLKSMFDDFVQKSPKLKTEEEVLLHGDFHTKNVFMHEQKIIAIDFDHHFVGDPAWDVAYLTCQIQVSSFFKKGDFDYFQPMIEKFVNTYLDQHLSYNRNSFLERISVYGALSLFESLHYELCVLKTGKLSIVDPFLTKCGLYLQGRGLQ